MTEDYETQNKWKGQVPSVKPFLFQLSRDDGADCISDIYSLHNPREDRQTECYGRQAEAGRLTREMYRQKHMCRGGVVSQKGRKYILNSH